MTPRVSRPAPVRRLAAELLDSILFVFTLCVGWLLWLSFTARSGQTPTKALLHVHIHNYRTGEVAGAKQVWLREVGWKSVIPALAALLLDALFGGISGAFLGVYFIAGALSVAIDSEQRAIWDRLSGTELRKASADTPKDGPISFVDPRIDDLMPSRRPLLR